MGIRGENFLVLVFSIILVNTFASVPFAFAQMDNSAICDESSEENPIIVFTDKQFYDQNDDKMIVSICMMPEVYHKHIQMSIFDSFGIEIERIFDPGVPCPNECLAQEPYFFVQEVSLDSFQKGQQYTVEVHASGIIETAFFEFGEKILHDICQNVSDENPIAVATNTRYYEIGDSGTIFGCVLKNPAFDEITVTVGYPNDFRVEEKVIPNEDGYFSINFEIKDKLDLGFWQLEANSADSNAYDGFVVTQTTPKSFFRTDNVESIINDQTWSNLTPADISSDDKILLLTGFQRIVMMNLEDKIFQEIQIPIELDKNSSITKAQFSTTTDEIFFTIHNDLYKIKISNGHTVQIFEDVEFFDLTFEDRIIFSTSSSNELESEESFHLWSSNSDGTDIVNLMEYNKDIKIFDVSPDGSKLLYTKSVLREPIWDTFVMIYDIETKQISQVPELNIYCGPTPKWSPNSQLIVFQYASCDRHFPETSLHITDIDGNRGYLTELDVFNSEYVISNDGSSIYYNLDPTGVYKMILAQPIPEFETIAIMILTMTLVPMLLLRKFVFLKLLNF